MLFVVGNCSPPLGEAQELMDGIMALSRTPFLEKHQGRKGCAHLIGCVPYGKFLHYTLFGVFLFLEKISMLS